MTLPTPTYGDRAWVGLAAYIATYDAYAVIQKKDTMSMAFHRALKHPVRRWPTIAVWLYLTAHLFKLIPDRFDPLRRLGCK